MSRKNVEPMDRETRAELASRIKSLRHQAGMRQEDLSKYAKVSRQTLSDIESGSVVPQEQSLKRILDVLGVETDEPRFEAQTELWLSTIGTLIEAVPAESRPVAVDKVIHVLGKEVQQANRSHLRVVSGDFQDEDYDIAATPDLRSLPHAAKRGRRKIDEQFTDEQPNE